jgi:hypothetical protein
MLISLAPLKKHLLTRRAEAPISNCGMGRRTGVGAGLVRKSLVFAGRVLRMDADWSGGRYMLKKSKGRRSGTACVGGAT